MIGYEMGSSPAVVYTTPKTSMVEDFKHEWKNDMVVCQHGNFFFARGVLWRSSLLGNLKPWEDKLDFQRIPIHNII